MSAQLLLVDDEPGLREAVKDYLQESGFNVQVASNCGKTLVFKPYRWYF
jgi:DNA-binding response OmpR family regulator